MKSTERPSKLPKQQPNDQSPKLAIVAYKPVEKQQEIPDSTKSDDLPLVESQTEPTAVPEVTSKAIADEKPLPLVKDKPYATGRKSNSSPQYKQQH